MCQYEKLKFCIANQCNSDIINKFKNDYSGVINLDNVKTAEELFCVLEAENQISATNIQALNRLIILIDDIEVITEYERYDVFIKCPEKKFYCDYYDSEEEFITDYEG